MKRNRICAFISVLVVSVLFSGVVVSNVFAQTVSEIQSAITAKGANWIARENQISRLSPSEKRNLMGLLDPPPGSTAHAPTCQVPSASLPASIDWRNNGGNYVSDVKNQGMCNSCWAYASTAALESAIMIANRTPNLNLNLMEAVLQSCCDTGCSAGPCSYGYLAPSASYLQSHGEPEESCNPTSCSYSCTNHKLKSWESIDGSVDSLRTALANYGPVVVGMRVYGDFMSYASGVYTHVSDSYVGNHAITAIGYNDAGQYFIAKNSWDTGWGEAGFFRIAYSEVTGDSQFGYQSIAYHGGDNPAPSCQYPIGDYFTASGGTGNAQVSAGSGCTWSATSNAAWLTITSGASGTGPGTVAFRVAANTTSSTRSGTMTLPGGTYAVIQAQGTVQCTYAISPTGNPFTASGGTGSISVTSASGCPWTATSGASWITITGGSTGSGSGSVSYAVAANTGSTSRSGTLTIGGNTFTVTQAAGATCTYTISPTSNSFTSASGTGAVFVNAGSGCAWTASSSATSWLTVTTGASGSGSGSVSYAVAANTGSTSRSGTLTIAGNTFTVSQAGGSCTYSITPATQNFTASAGTGTVSVASATNCAWTASTASSWITINGAKSGSGSGTVTYSVAPNASSYSRWDVISIAGQSHTVVQAAGGCTYTVTPVSQAFTAAASVGSVGVTCDRGCAWTATSNVSWITITSGAGSSRSDWVNYVTTANTGASRTGTLTVAGTTVTVTQAGGGACTVSITPTSQNLTASAGGGSVSVTAPSGCPWTATSGASWITITGGSTGSGSGSVSYAVAANTGSTSRSGTLTIGGNTFTVTQAAGATCTYTISPTSNSFTSASGTGAVFVNAGSGCAWTASSSATSWLTVTTGASGSGSGSVSYAVAANTGSTSRSGTLTIAGNTFTVSQAGGSCTYSITPATQNFTASAGTGTVSVASATNCAWTASTASSWITINGAKSGSGSGTVTYSVAPNASSYSRWDVISIAGQSHTVVQAAGGCTYTVTPVSQAFTAAASVGSVGVTCDRGCAWTATSNVSWITITSGAGSSRSDWVNYVTTANTGASRTGTLTVAGTTVTVTQAGNPAKKGPAR